MTFENRNFIKDDLLVQVVGKTDDLHDAAPLMDAYYGELRNKNPMSMGEGRALALAQDIIEHSMGRVIACRDVRDRKLGGFCLVMYDDWHTHEIWANILAIYVGRAFRRTPAVKLLLDVAETMARADGAVYFQTECPNFIQRNSKLYQNLLSKRGYEFFPKAIKRLV